MTEITWQKVSDNEWQSNLTGYADKPYSISIARLPGGDKYTAWQPGKSQNPYAKVGFRSLGVFTSSRAARQAVRAALKLPEQTAQEMVSDDAQTLQT